MGRSIRGESCIPDLRYPIGPFEAGPPPQISTRFALLSQLAEAPNRLRRVVADLSEHQLDTPYRPDGWTVRQVVHHLADAQMNWYVRTKLALTEDAPRVKSYDEVQWAELHDARTGAIEPSLMLLDGLYRRWIALFISLSEEQWKRTLLHSERGIIALDSTLSMHVWHGCHHTAHIVQLKKRLGWR